MNKNDTFSSYLPSRYNSQNPVINLIQIRCSQAFISKIPPTSLVYKLFNNLILFETNQIQLLSKNLTKNSLLDSFQCFLQLFNFNSNNFINDLDKLSSNYQISKSQYKSTDCIDQYLIITFYFYFLEFIIFHKQFFSTRNEKRNMEASKKQAEAFVKLIQLLNLFGKPQDEVIEMIHSYLFIQLVLHFLNFDSISNINQMILPPKMDCHVEWTQEMYDQCAVQFLIGPVFRMSSNHQNSNQFAHSLILAKFTQKSIKSNDAINPSKILEIIYSLLIERRVSFDNIQICSILLPLIQQLNTKSIKIISILSSTSKSLASVIKDDFIQLPPILFQKIMGNAINDYETKNDDNSNSVVNHPSISKELFLSNSNSNENSLLTRQPSKELLTESQQQIKLGKTKSSFFEKKMFYKEKDPKAFENGFIAAQSKININLIDLFNQNGMSHFLIDFFYSMENANNEYLDEFIFAYYKLLSIYLDSEFYFDLYIIGFMFIDKFKDRINLSDLFCFLFDSQVFNPKLTIFNNNSQDISIVTTIRFNILNIYVCEMDGILPNFFIKSQYNSFLFTEMISYVMQSSNFQNNNTFLQSFISVKFIHSFFKVLNSLIYERYKLNSENNKDGIFSAFQTDLSFLFNLLNDHSRGESLFQLNSFCRKFLSLVFIDSLQNVTLTTIRNLLLTVNPTSMAIPQITICISQLLQTLQNENLSDSEQSLNISIDIVQNLVSLLSSNGSISPFFTNIFDFVLNLKHFPNLLEYSLTFTSLISRNIPNFKLKSYQLKNLAHIIVKECKASDSDKSDNSEFDSISDQTYLLLLNLCAATTILGNSTMFLIKQPTFIPLVFIVFQNSPTKLRSILQNFIDLCNYSISNCFACHFSGIDFLLLEFIYNFKIKNTNKISFRQIEFNLNFALEDITKYILPFLSLILTYATDSVIISKIIEIINESNDNEISLTMSSFLLNSITNSKSQLAILHPLGYNIPFYVVDDVNPEIFNKRFVFTFWIKIDKLVALSEKDSVEIIRISNRKSIYRKFAKIPDENINDLQPKESINLQMQSSEQRHKKKKDLLSTTFRLFVKRGVFYFSFYTPGKSPVTEEILQNIESNEWLFCAFVTQRTSTELSSVCLFSGNHVGYCQDVNKIYFPETYPITISFGGKKVGINSINNNNNNNPNNDHQLFKPFNLFKKSSKENDLNEIINNSIEQNEGNLVGVLGPFALFDTLLNEDDLSSLSKEGPSMINDDFNGWIIKSSKSLNEFSIQSSILNKVNTVKNISSFVPHSIISEICLHNHIIQLSKPFFSINKTSQKLLGTIIGIMKQIFLTSSFLQKEFIYFDIIAKLIISSSFESEDNLVNVSDNDINEEEKEASQISNHQIRINYHLYLNFLSLFECISYTRTSELFFDSLLINVELWYLCCNASNFNRIVFHWSHTLINMYPSFFKRTDFLLKLYKTYFVIFDENIVKKLINDNKEMKVLKSPIINYSKGELNECDERFLFLLEEATKLVVSFDNDFLFYFYTIIDLIEKEIDFKNSEKENETHYQRLKFFLNILIKNAGKFKQYEGFDKFLFNIVFEEKYSDNSEIIKLAIFAIHELRSPKWFESMSSIGYVILIHQKLNEENLFKWEKLIKSLLAEIEFYPGIMHLISFFILNSKSIHNNQLSAEINENQNENESNKSDENDENKSNENENINNSNITDLEFSRSMNKLMFNVLYQTWDKEKTPVFIKNIISDEYWFLWLLFIAVQSENEECRQSIMLLISNFVSFSEKAEKELNEIIGVILILNSFIKNIDEYAIFLDLFVNILYHGTISISSTVTSLIFSFFFKFCHSFHNDNLINQIESSPLFEKENKDENENVFSDDDKDAINSIINKFIKFAKNEKVIKIYKLRFGLNLSSNNDDENKKLSSIEKLYDLLAQTLHEIDNKFNFPGYKKILEFISSVLKSRYIDKENEEETKNETRIEICNIKLSEVINYFNDTFLKHIFKSIQRIKQIIERVESIEDFEIANNYISNDVKAKFNDIQILSSLFQKTTVNNYFNFITNFISLEINSKKEICRDFYSFLFPFKTKYREHFDVLPIESIDYFDDKELKNSSQNEHSLIQAKATFYNFNDDPKEVCYILHLNDFLSQIIDFETKIKMFSIPLNTILFINSNSNMIEIFTQNQGSFYLTFNESNIEYKTAILTEFTKSSPQLSKSIKEILSSYLTNPMTNYEYLMYLNIISGYSFHDPDPKNKPTFPRLNQNEKEKVKQDESSNVLDEIPVYDFLFKNGENPFSNLEELEMIDDSLIDEYAKTKYKENYFVKNKSELKEMNEQLNKNQNHNETHQIIKDLTLNPDKMRKSGFFHLVKDQNEYELFYLIIKKEGLIHFIQISNEPYVQHFSTQKSSLLVSNNEDEDVVIIEDFEIDEKHEKNPGILIFSKKMKKMQRITPFECSSLIDINIELSVTLFSSLYSFSYIHQSSSSLMNSIRASSASFYTSKNSLISSSSSTVSSQMTKKSNLEDAYQYFYRSDFCTADTDLNLFSMIHNELIFISNKCDIKQTVNLNDLLNQMKSSDNKIIPALKSDNFFNSGNSVFHSKIVCIASNEKFKALAVGTEKCKVIIYSLYSKEVTTIIDLDSKEPEKILITSNFGFIVIEAQKTIFVYTINGQKIGEKEINFDVLEWHFSSSTFSHSEYENDDGQKKKYKKADFVVFMNSVNDIGVFDASNPNFIQFVSPSSGLIAAFDYMSFRSYNCIVVVSINYGSIIGFYPIQDFK